MCWVKCWALKKTHIYIYVYIHTSMARAGSWGARGPRSGQSCQLRRCLAPFMTHLLRLLYCPDPQATPQTLLRAKVGVKQHTCFVFDLTSHLPQVHAPCQARKGPGSGPTAVLGVGLLPSQHGEQAGWRRSRTEVLLKRETLWGRC